MKTKLCLATVIALSFLLSSHAVEPVASQEAAVKAPEFKNLSDLKWDKILPDLGANSPEISVLHVDPKTHATSLLIRTRTSLSFGSGRGTSSYFRTSGPPCSCTTTAFIAGFSD